MKRALTLQAKDGTIDAAIFTPSGATGPHPGVVMFTDIGGLRESFDVKRRSWPIWATPCCCRNIYYRQGSGSKVPPGKSFHAPEVIQTLRGYAQALTPQALAGDFDALLSGMQAAAECAAGPVGVVGYC